MDQADLEEPVTQEEFEKEVENFRESWRVFYGFHERLAEQGAPDSLLEELKDLTRAFQTMHFRMNLLSRYFPRQEKQADDSD